MNKILALLIIFNFQLSIFNSATAQEKIILLNEGNWQADNGRLSYFEDGKVVSNKWFQEKNGAKLGDTPNDIVQISDNLIAIAMNWSNIIQFIRPDGTAVAATEDVPNCRNMVSDGNYLYVTSYAHECGDKSKGFHKEFTKGYVAKIDVSTFRITDAVEVGYEPDGIALYDGRLFVANSGGYAATEGHDYERTVSVINASTMEVEKTIDTGTPNLYGHIAQAGKYLLINSAGDYYETAASSLVFDCEKALKGENPCFVKLTLPATYSTTTLDGRFLVIGSAFSYETYSFEYSQATIDPILVSSSHGSDGVTQSFPGTMASDIAAFSAPYSLYVNPYTGYMYSTDASSYADGGKMYQWTPEGRLSGSWKVYINPGHFLALPPDGKFNGITEISNDTKANDKYYDLQGRTVASPRHNNIYIHKGKKVIFK